MKKADPFYVSHEWRAFRDQVLKRDHGRCRRCGRPARTVHHIRELTDGGTRLDPANAESVCNRCHALAHPSKGGRHD
jgi:5-methylcytosine-specific restriction enzyme A